MPHLRSLASMRLICCRVSASVRLSGEGRLGGLKNEALRRPEKPCGGSAPSSSSESSMAPTRLTGRYGRPKVPDGTSARAKPRSGGGGVGDPPQDTSRFVG